MANSKGYRVTIDKVLFEIRPNSQWNLVGDDYEGLDWKDENQDKPSKQEVLAKQAEMQLAFDNQEYARQRANAYPPMADYLDGIVKGDQAQIDAYVAACLAVKEQFPKPE